MVAGKLATVLKTEKLVLLTNTLGGLNKPGGLTDLNVRKIDELFADGTISGWHAAQNEGALDAPRGRHQLGAHHGLLGALCNGAPFETLSGPLKRCKASCCAMRAVAA